jgi:hypothetical protein
MFQSICQLRGSTDHLSYSPVEVAAAAVVAVAARALFGRISAEKTRSSSAITMSLNSSQRRREKSSGLP